MSQIFKILKVIGLIAVLTPAIALYVLAQTPVEAGFGDKPDDEKSFQDYVVKTYCDPDSGTGRFELYRRGKLIYQKKNHHFYIGLIDREDKAGNDAVAMGRDLTGKGIPNLLISEWSGGAHCCYRFYLFEIGKEFRKIAEIKAGDSDLAGFKDLNKDKRLEFIGNDSGLSYWICSRGTPALRGIIGAPTWRRAQTFAGTMLGPVELIKRTRGKMP